MAKTTEDEIAAHRRWVMTHKANMADELAEALRREIDHGWMHLQIDQKAIERRILEETGIIKMEGNPNYIRGINEIINDALKQEQELEPEPQSTKEYMTMDKLKVINLFAGPGCGKSTLSLDLCARLKHAGYNIELVREFAKELVWEFDCVPDHITQEMILKEQDRRQRIMIGKVDLVVTDSPLLIATLYGSNKEDAYRLFNDYDNINVRVERKKPYNPAGRYQTEEEACELDVEALQFDCEVAFPGTKQGGEQLYEYVVNLIETSNRRLAN